MYKADYYHIPTAIDKTIADHIIKNAHILGTDREISMIGGTMNDAGSMDKKRRDSTQRWMPTDNWIAGMMAHYINEANRNYFKFDLDGWASQLQYTEYKGKGKHYNWHCDSADATTQLGYVRKLSISLILSDVTDYEGGELQLMFPGNATVFTMRPTLGDAIIFPSVTPHRVRPLKSGNRISLVGWYGGPPFR